MADFKGWLLKIDGVEFPTSLIAYDSYKCTPNQVTDIDDYTDSKGVFHRNILPALASKIEFEVKPCYLAEKKKIQEIITSRESMKVQYWNDETNSYLTGTFYCPDITFEVHAVYPDRKDILYNSIRIALIEYGEER